MAAPLRHAAMHSAPLPPLELQEREARWLLPARPALGHAAMHSAASYVDTPWSFDTLPTAGEWAGGQASYWEERVRRTSTQQLLVLHREGMHCNAILLPAAEMQGTDSPAHMKVRGGRAGHCNAMLLPAAEMHGPPGAAHVKVRGED